MDPLAGRIIDLEAEAVENLKHKKCKTKKNSAAPAGRE